MASRVIRVIDLSEWTRDIPLANARCMIDQHQVEGVILQAWGGGPNAGRRNDYFHQGVDSFREAFRLAGKPAYIDPYCWPPGDWEACLRWIGVYKRYMSGAFYLDVEAGAGMNQGHVDGVRAAGWEPRVYVSPNGWATLMGNTRRFNDLKLWLARYLLRFQRADGYYRPGWDVNFPDDAFGGSGFGGFTRGNLVGWQTTGTVPNFCGESVDTSMMYESAFSAGEEEDEDMADPQARAAIDVLIESAHLQQAQIDFLAAATAAQQIRLNNLDPGDIGANQGAITALQEKLARVEGTAEANAKKLAAAAEALS